MGLAMLRWTCEEKRASDVGSAVEGIISGISGPVVKSIRITHRLRG